MSFKEKGIVSQLGSKKKSKRKKILSSFSPQLFVFVLFCFYHWHFIHWFSFLYPLIPLSGHVSVWVLNMRLGISDKILFWVIRQCLMMPTSSLGFSKRSLRERLFWGKIAQEKCVSLTSRSRLGVPESIWGWCPFKHKERAGPAVILDPLTK